MRFNIVASTGRTATTFMAAALNHLDGVVATHEGYRGSDKNSEPLLPLVNLENAAAYSSPKTARHSVATLRGVEVLSTVMDLTPADHLIDVAYYNAMLGEEILALHPQARMIGIIRDCEGFVRSATTIEGEDPLPVGWPDPNKSLSEREKFISMGRIRPGKASSDRSLWSGWGAIQRNIWLWRETNLRLCAAKDAYEDRVALVRFATFQCNPPAFWEFGAKFFDLPLAAIQPPTPAKKMANKKPAGYQIGSSRTWSAEEQTALNQSQSIIDKAAKYAL